MGNIFAELKRRHVYRVAAAYAVVAWVLLQLFNNLTPIMKLPDWVGMFVLVLLVGGFPIALFFAWMRELPTGDTAATKTGTMDWVLLGALAVVIGIFTYQQIAPPPGATTSPVRQAGVEAARAAAAAPAGISVAVLPFANLSTDKEQEFFSDGMTEDIITALAKIPDLRVVARESAFQYKGEKNDVRAVGQALNATHLIEGSVRKVGTRVRVTAQLVKAEDGVNIWADSYDRDLTDVFAIQEEIARAIAASLRMPLGLKPGENLVANRSIDVELYQQFLRLRALARASTGSQVVANVLPELETLVARDPNFAPAWAYLSQLSLILQGIIDRTIWTRPPETTRRLMQPGIEKIEKAAREAIRLDPRQASAYASLAIIETNQKRWAAAEDLLRKALEFDPYDPDVLFGDGEFLYRTGRIKDSLRVLQQAQALDPLFRIYALGVARVLMADNQPDAAIAMIEPIRLRTTLSFTLLAQAYSMAGRFNDAANTILLIQRNFFGHPQAVEEAARLIRDAPTKISDPSALPAWPGRLDFVYAYVGAPERLLDYPERAIQADELAAVEWFAPNYKSVRTTERFKKLVRDAGLVDYWKARGWPDLCHPTTSDDFVCD